MRVFITGQGWLNLPDWPPPTTERVLYLQPDGGLGPRHRRRRRRRRRSGMTRRSDSHRGRSAAVARRRLPRRRVAGRRADVLSFTGDPLTEDLCVHGNPVIELAHSSDNPHVDVFVRISEVDARARSRNVSDGYRRLTGGAGAVHLEMDAIAHRFRAGSRIRVLVAGGCHPRFARNLGTGEPPVSGTELKPATHVVRFGASRLVLPLA
ncbi:hydrolase CocE/NonD family protein [Mycobacterium xenopi 4042]|uniref:Hydrolase CocE/NonD family protein n=1 Tax=Mycobacterium xenopi 4042 TaxID=1299334 RepID=X8CDK0_MYCXE|nr:hydrolase CocE/NonD family protein [Mycobacterium xenopi 4042]